MAPAELGEYLWARSVRLPGLPVVDGFVLSGREASVTLLCSFPLFQLRHEMPEWDARWR